MALLLLLLAQDTFEPTDSYKKQDIRGWTVHVSGRLMKNDPKTGEKVVALLKEKLGKVEKAVPKKALAKLKKVKIWLSERDPKKKHPGAVYHPSGKWLKDNGYNPDMEKSVELANAKNFLAWSKDQPWMVLHELAHAYHHQILGYGHKGIKEAFEEAKKGGAYEKVKHVNGRTVRHYALTNMQEYFAEASEAYFGKNDMFPFDREELKKHDPTIFRLLKKVWNP